ncbi:MAG: substrate-binding domain-containing protein [Beijerinckiaceae bacterium]
MNILTQDHIYLNTEQAAVYLDIKERKLYEMVAQRAVPCSKVTGKWLFPRAALDRWVEAGLTVPDGFSAQAAPAIIGGSHDPLLEWAARRSGCGLALLSEGSAHGLHRLDRNEIALAALHLHEDETAADANVAAVRASPHLHDAVVVAFARREQGLMVAVDNPLKLTSLEASITLGARFGQRQSGAGAQLLLQALLTQVGKALSDLPTAGEAFATGQDLAFAIRTGDVDCGIATRAVANANGLGFVPLAWEQFDLALRRHTYFEAGPQKLFGLMRDPEFHRHAAILGGYDTSEAGAVRMNR